MFQLFKNGRDTTENKNKTPEALLLAKLYHTAFGQNQTGATVSLMTYLINEIPGIQISSICH
jgi:hypothetical protein